VSVGDVAANAGVSKALVLYHFTDKESLLVALVESVGHGVIEREESALSGRDAAHALDGYWQWLEAELERGDLRILRALADYESERVRMASRRIARNRRQVAAGHVASIFDRLSLTPRIPPDLLAETLVAFVDGLAGARALEPERDARPAFDALWLALLTLTE
jgi:AcrR family transcriptional regulator